MPGIRRLETGLDVLVGSGFADLAGQRVGVISNPTDVDSTYRHLVDLMHASGAVAMLVEARRYPAFAWRRDSWDAARPYWVDKLTGSPRLRTMIDTGAKVDDVVGAWADELAAFERQRAPHLLY